MISRENYLKERAVDILADRVEGGAIRLGAIIPNAKLNLFGGGQKELYDFIKENTIVLAFLRGSW